MVFDFLEEHKNRSPLFVSVKAPDKLFIMMPTLSPESTALDLGQRWNHYSPDTHAELYDEEVEFTCSLVKRLLGESLGKLSGRGSLIEYWQKMRSRYPDMLMVHHRSDWHGKQIMMELSMPPLSRRVLGPITLNEDMKITRLRLSHV